MKMRLFSVVGLAIGLVFLVIGFARADGGTVGGDRYLVHIYPSKLITRAELDSLGIYRIAQYDGFDLAALDSEQLGQLRQLGMKVMIVRSVPDPMGVSLVAGDPYAQAGVAYLKAKWPERLVELSNKHIETDRETGISYTSLKTELDGEESVYLTVRHADHWVHEGRDLANDDKLAYIQNLPVPYRKMNAELRAHIKDSHGGVLPEYPENSAGEVIRVILTIQSGADIDAIAAVAARWSPDPFIYDGEALRRQLGKGDAVFGGHKPLRIVAADLTLAQLNEIVLDWRIRSAWLNAPASASLNLSVPHIKADVVQGYGYTGDNIGVAVIDSGVDETHPNVYVSICSNFTDETDCDDLNGHGTHVAGIVSSDHATFTGMAPDAIILNAKVMTSGGGGLNSWMLAGMDWAAVVGVDAIQMSLGSGSTTDGYSQPTLLVDEIVYTENIPFMISTGNRNAVSNPFARILAPADAFNSISVGASNGVFLDVWVDSGHGYTADGRTKVDVIAPGVDINSAAHDWEGANPDFVVKTGTSMATPHVSGLVAQLKEYGEQQGLSTDARLLKAVIMTSAEKFDGWRHTKSHPLDLELGAGQIDAKAAYGLYANEYNWIENTATGTDNASDQFYLFEVLDGPVTIVSTLVWQRHITDYQAATQPLLNDLDLHLLPEAPLDRTEVLSKSVSYFDNVEHISYTIDTPGHYWLRVDAADLTAGGAEEYALVGNFNFNYHGSTPLLGFYKSGPSNLANGIVTNPTLSWTKSVGAYEYAYCIDTTDNNACDFTWNGVSGLSTQISNLTPNTTYYWQLRSRSMLAPDNMKYADLGEWWQFSTYSMQPQGLGASDGAYYDKVALDWSDVGDAVIYEVYRATSAGGAKTVIGYPSSSAFDDTTALPERVYYYWVKACNALACGSLSTNNTGWRRISEPGGVAASDGTYSDKVALTWGSVSGATFYEVYRATSPGGTKSMLGIEGDLYFADTSATPERSYYYVVKACNSYGCGDFSAYNSGWRKMGVAASMASSDGTYTNKIRASWPGVSGATYYRVFRGLSEGSGTYLDDAGDAFYDDAAAIPGRVYFYSVEACNAYGCGEVSGENQGWREMGVPGNLYASEGSYSDKVRVYWDAVYGIDNYKLYRAEDEFGGGQILLAGPTTNNYNDTSALDQKDYYYAIQACNGYRCSSMSDYDLGWRGIETPTGLAASDGAYTDKVQLSWDTVSDAYNYKIYRGPYPNDLSYIGDSNPWTTSYDDTPPAPERTYYYAVEACNIYGCGDQSDPEGGWRMLGVPSGISATDDVYDALIVTTWSSVAESTYYQVFRGLSPGSQAYIGAAGGEVYSDTTALPNTTYYYYVAACNGHGCGDQSSYDQGDCNTGDVVSVSASDGTYTDKILVNWSPVLGADQYAVWRAEAGGTYYFRGYTTETQFEDSNGVVEMKLYDYYITVGYGGDPSPIDSGWRKLAPPQSVQASDGDLFGSVKITYSTSESYYPLWAEISRAAAPGGPWGPPISGSLTSGNDYDVPQVATNYYYKARACNSYGCGDYSPYDSGWAGDPSTTIVASDGSHTDKVAITWDPVEGADYYNIWRTTTPDSPNSWWGLNGIHAILGIVYHDASAIPGVVYYYEIESCVEPYVDCDRSGSPDTGWREMPVVTDVQASDGVEMGSVQVAWEEEPTATHYEIYRTDAPGGVKEYLGLQMSESYLDTGLAPGEVYSYSVKACYETLCAAYSDPDSGYAANLLYLPVIVKLDTAAAANSSPTSNRLVGLGGIFVALAWAGYRWMRNK